MKSIISKRIKMLLLFVLLLIFWQPQTVYAVKEQTIYRGMDYSDIYNFQYYTEKYADIKLVYGNNPKGALEHFINFGMAESRQGSKKFDINFYKNSYPDLQSAFGSNSKPYYNHYMNYGKKEGRLGSLIYNGVDYSLVFNPEYYANKYGDIKRALGNNAPAIFNHFVNFGMAEGRQGSEAFAPQFYRNLHDDLRKVYANNMKLYYQHYIFYGKNENRLATSQIEVKPVKEYEIIQYGDKDGAQSMFYTIQAFDGGLIVIDGGYASASNKVRQVIAEKGNVVDCWILTHPHPDHIGAFNTIYANPDGINIKDVYTIKADNEKFKNAAQSWDDLVTLETFNRVIEGKSVHYLNQGDIINLLGLKLKVYNAYADYIPGLTTDLFNDGSLIIEIEGETESMLFCSDVGVRMSDAIINKYGQELKADYIQMGHHGNGGLSDEFYRLVNPKIAFFDAPDWLMDNIDPITGESLAWTTPERKALMESLGARIYSFSTSPNKIVLK